MKLLKYGCIVLGATLLIKHIFLPKGSPYMGWLYGAMLAAIVIPVALSRGAKAEEAEVYTTEEMEAVQAHIDHHFGTSHLVFHELISPDIHVDVCVIFPAEGRDYITLVTMGMGAHRMNVPQAAAGEFSPRAELLIYLPADWKLDRESLQKARWYWPIRWLKQMARLPGATNSWLAPTHTLSGEDAKPIAPGSRLNSFVIGYPVTPEDSRACTLPGGDSVHFYRLIPLYPEELAFALKHGARPLLSAIDQQLPPPVSPTRPSLKLPPAQDE